MQSFLEAFFPEIIEKMNNAQQDAYCIFDSQVLTTFVSSLSLAGVFACLAAGHVTRRVGRRNSMLIGASFFLVGAILNCAAVNIYMLVIGRILLGFAVGFTNQVITLTGSGNQLPISCAHCALLASSVMLLGDAHRSN